MGAGVLIGSCQKLEARRLGEISRAQYPQLPLVLKSRPADYLFGLPEANDGRHYKPTGGGNRDEPGYYTQNHLSELRRLKPKQTKEIPYEQYFHERFGSDAPFPAHHSKSDIVVTRVAWPEAQARIDELIAAIEGWRKACRRIDHATGYMKAQRDFQHLANKVFALDDEVSELEANSLRGLQVKARTLQLIHRDDEDIGFGKTTDQVLALSIVKGLLALPAQQS